MRKKQNAYSSVLILRHTFHNEHEKMFYLYDQAGKTIEIKEHEKRMYCVCVQCSQIQLFYFKFNLEEIALEKRKTKIES